jgi:hypothetical protein
MEIGMTSNESSAQEQIEPGVNEDIEDDRDFLDSTDALKSYFGLSIVEESKKLVRVKFVKHSAVARRVFVAIAAAQRLLGTRDFKVGQTAGGAVYICTFGEHLAWLLDGQKNMDFGTQIVFERVPDIECEPVMAKGTSAAFKLYDRHVYFSYSCIISSELLSTFSCSSRELRTKIQMLDLLTSSCTGPENIHLLQTKSAQTYMHLPAKVKHL